MRSLRNIRLIVAFQGTAYHGWQIQKDLLTVQGVLQQAIESVTGEAVSLIGSGRTDAGTHARALAANFKSSTRIPPANLVKALNSRLPRDIRVLSARRQALDFHARRSARSKVYRYQIYRGAVLPPHLAVEYYHFPFDLSLPAMRQAATHFVGTHDFASFAATPRGGPQGEENTIRTVISCGFASRGRRLLFTVEGDGFLHHMVRNMVGTLLEVGQGRIAIQDFVRLFQLRDRSRSGFTAPAHGLVLLRVRY